MGFNEAVRNINVQKYLEEKDGFGDGGRFNKPFKIDYKQEAGLLAEQAEIQERKIEEALKSGREKTAKQANKELKKITEIKTFFEEIKKVFKEDGDVLIALLNNYTISEEIHIVPGNQNETKAIAPLSSFSNIGVMELSYTKDHKQPKQDLATLTVLSSSEEGCLEKLNPDFRFIIIVPNVLKEKESKSKIRFVDFRSKRQEFYDLSNDYDKHLLEDILVGIIQSLMIGRE